MTGGLTGGATTHYLTGGDVGIGTSSPVYLLEVNGVVASDATMVRYRPTRLPHGEWQL